jgi:LacI family transcriptional regulator
MNKSLPNRPKKRILICKDRESSNFITDRILLGIQQVALARTDWKTGQMIAFEVRKGTTQDVLGWKPDGLLVICRPSAVPDILHVPDLPTVVVDIYHERPDVVCRLEPDDEAVGRQAAAYFLHHHFEHFGVVVSPENPLFSQLREQGFTEALAAEGIQVARFEIEHLIDRPWYRNPALEEWLTALPKPAGVYGVSDATVLRVMDHCEQIGIRIPSQISLLGTDNHPVICSSVRPSISSVPHPAERIGIRAAEVLEDLMQQQAAGSTPELHHELVGPDPVMERQSTSLRAIPDPVIAKAVNYLHDHALEGATADEAAQAAGVNRRTMERGFRELLGLSPGQYIAEVKIDHAKRLLLETDLRMWEIASRCGMSPEYFNTLFRRLNGQTPNTFRKDNTPRLPTYET